MTQKEQQIEIPLSKKKLALMLIGSVVFVTLGFLFVITPTSFISPYCHSATKIFISGLASILFFGLCGISIARKITVNKPGLIINNNGLIDNSSGVAAGQILWADIDNISIFKIRRQKLIILHVKNPQIYIDKQTSIFKRKAMTINYKICGTPLSITSNGLKISFDELFKTITDNFNASKQ